MNCQRSYSAHDIIPVGSDWLRSPSELWMLLASIHRRFLWYNGRIHGSSIEGAQGCIALALLTSPSLLYLHVTTWCSAHRNCSNLSEIPEERSLATSTVIYSIVVHLNHMHEGNIDDPITMHARVTPQYQYSNCRLPQYLSWQKRCILSGLLTAIKFFSNMVRLTKTSGLNDKFHKISNTFS